MVYIDVHVGPLSEQTVHVAIELNLCHILVSAEFGEHAHGFDLLFIPIIPNYILEGPPTMKRVTTALPKASKEELDAAFAASMMEFQTYNTALWDPCSESGTVYPVECMVFNKVVYIPLRKVFGSSSGQGPQATSGERVI